MEIQKRLLVDASKNFEYRRMVEIYEEFDKAWDKRHDELHEEFEKFKDEGFLGLTNKLKEEGLLEQSFNLKSKEENISVDKSSMCIFLEKTTNKMTGILKEILGKL